MLLPAGSAGGRTICHKHQNDKDRISACLCHALPDTAVVLLAVGVPGYQLVVSATPQAGTPCPLSTFYEGGAFATTSCQACSFGTITQRTDATSRTQCSECADAMLLLMLHDVVNVTVVCVATSCG
jgi:hypothetical protein